MHKWVATLGILATLFAILTSVYPESLPAWGRTTVGIVLILLPILASSMAAFVNRFYPGNDWHLKRVNSSHRERVRLQIWIPPRNETTRQIRRVVCLCLFG